MKLQRITSGDYLFKDKDNLALYVFAFDAEINIAAPADNPNLVGMN